MIRVYDDRIEDRLADMTLNLQLAETRAEELRVVASAFRAFPTPEHFAHILDCRRERMHREIQELRLKIAMLPRHFDAIDNAPAWADEEQDGARRSA